MVDITSKVHCTNCNRSVSFHSLIEIEDEGWEVSKRGHATCPNCLGEYEEYDTYYEDEEEYAYDE